MTRDVSHLSKHFAQMEPEEFDNVNPDDLTAEARSVYAQELARRKTAEWRAQQAQTEKEHEERKQKLNESQNDRPSGETESLPLLGPIPSTLRGSLVALAVGVLFVAAAIKLFRTLPPSGLSYAIDGALAFAGLRNLIVGILGGTAALFQGECSRISVMDSSRISATYSQMSDEQFAQLNREDLTEEAKAAYDREAERRGSSESKGEEGKCER